MYIFIYYNVIDLFFHSFLLIYLFIYFFIHLICLVSFSFFNNEYVEYII